MATPSDETETPVPNPSPGAMLGERLRNARKASGLSLRKLASSIGVSPSLLSQIENAKIRPSVSTLYALASELGLSIDGLFAESEGPHPPSAGGPLTGDLVLQVATSLAGGRRVERNEERPTLTLESGVTWELLTQLPAIEAELLRVVVPVGGASNMSGDLMRHAGAEYGYVLRGQLSVTVGFDEYILQPGDSISYVSSTPHRMENRGDSPVDSVWLVVGRGFIR